MNIIIKTITKIAFPIILVFGIYIILHGHLTPGGSFPGGVIIAGGVVLFTLAHGIYKAEKEIKKSFLDFLKALAGEMLILLILLDFFIITELVPTQKLFSFWSGGDLLFFNIFGGIMVSTALILIWFVMVEK